MGKFAVCLTEIQAPTEFGKKMIKKNKKKNWRVEFKNNRKEFKEQKLKNFVNKNLTVKV
jgi:hypothetical protein